jgi:hypothetical protein
MKNTIIICTIMLTVIIVNSCKKDKVPVLNTSNVSNLHFSSASCGGNILDDGGASISERGLCWSTSQTPTISDNKITNGSGVGTYISEITGLNFNTIYYVRAFATNSAGTGYGNTVAFPDYPFIWFQGDTTSLIFNGTNSIFIKVGFLSSEKIQSISLSGPSLTSAGTTTISITDKMGVGHNENSQLATFAAYYFQVSNTDLNLAFANHTSLIYTFTFTDKADRQRTDTFIVTN